MATIRQVIEAEGNSSFSIQVIENNGKHWIRLSSSSNLSRSFGYWSEQDMAADRMPIEEIVNELSSRLSGLSVDKVMDIKDAIEIWPKGWDFWSFGTPAPILDYVSYQLKDSVVEFVRNNS
jgi:hypothetical protein